jgi:hypothetical protein
VLQLLKTQGNFRGWVFGTEFATGSSRRLEQIGVELGAFPQLRDASSARLSEMCIQVSDANWGLVEPWIAATLGRRSWGILARTAADRGAARTLHLFADC